MSKINKLEKDYIFILIITMIQAVFLIYQIANRNMYTIDSYEYLTEADNIKVHGEFYCGNFENEDEVDYDQHTKRPPLYPLFILLIKYIFKYDIFILVFQNIISIISIWLIRKTALYFGYQKQNDKFFLLLIFCSPAQFIYANMIFSEILFQFCLVLIIYYFSLFIMNKRNIHFTLYNVFIVFAALTKPVMYLFVIPNLLIAVYIALKNKKVSPLFNALIPIIFFVFFSFWNMQRTSHFHFSSIQTINLVNYNTYYLLVNKYGEKEAEKVIDSLHFKAAKIEDYSQKTKYLNNQALDLIKKNLMNYTFFHIKGIITFFIDPGRIDISTFWGVEKKSSKGFLFYLNEYGFVGVIDFLFKQNPLLIFTLLLIAFVNIIKIIGLACFFLNRKVDLLMRIIIFFVIFYIAFATGPLGASRFIMPLIPIIIAMILINKEALTTLKRLVPTFK